MNTKVAMYGLFALGALGLFGTTLTQTLAAEDTASQATNTVATTECNGPAHHGDRDGIGFGQMLDDQAEILGMTTDDLKALFDEGKRLPEILAEQGIDETAFHEAMQAAHQEFLQSEVEAGNLTQEQVDAMIERMANHVPGETPEFAGTGMRGMHKGGFGQGNQTNSNANSNN